MRRRHAVAAGTGAAALLAVLLATQGGTRHRMATPQASPAPVSSAASSDAASAAPPAVYQPAIGGSCGVERRAVKTATDPAASTIATTPEQSTIAALDAIGAPSNPTTRIKGLEDRLVTIHATLTAWKQESDSDLHLALTDGGSNLIAEIPAPSCARGSRLLAQITAARRAFDAKHTSSGTYQQTLEPVTVTGVIFFDRIHGQRGVAPTGVELHPVTGIVLG